ncbi:MAG TPA: D-aminoacyl-tRNA deacylase [Candidatus Binataceae bacterium]|nr:D-aminoacyl-tRNA deacylase [Candidatus Binataceae bacterium]
MRAILQRVSRAEVRSGGRILGRIGLGLVVLLGVARGDSESDAAFLADQILGMRVFADAEGKMNLAIGKVGGGLIIVSQFTLLADTEAGRRPSFNGAAAPDEARRLYEYFLSLVRKSGVTVEQGEFGAMMEVEIVNDGPVTIILDSRNR